MSKELILLPDGGELKRDGEHYTIDFSGLRIMIEFDRYPTRVTVTTDEPPGYVEIHTNSIYEVRRIRD